MMGIIRRSFSSGVNLVAWIIELLFHDVIVVDGLFHAPFSTGRNWLFLSPFRMCCSSEQRVAEPANKHYVYRLYVITLCSLVPSPDNPPCLPSVEAFGYKPSQLTIFISDNLSMVYSHRTMRPQVFPLNGPTPINMICKLQSSDTHPVHPDIPGGLLLHGQFPVVNPQVYSRQGQSGWLGKGVSNHAELAWLKDSISKKFSQCQERALLPQRWGITEPVERLSMADDQKREYSGDLQ